MPMIPGPMLPGLELKRTGDKTNLLGFVCEKYELKQFGQSMEIWATDQLLPFQSYTPSQPHHFGPPRIEEQCGELLKARKLFPLLAILKLEIPSHLVGGAAIGSGLERYRFEVKSVRAEQITDASLLQPPPGYREIQPLPF